MMTTETLKACKAAKIRTKTNGEAAEVADKTLFLLWLHKESAPVPQSLEEMESLMIRWIEHRRREGIWA